MQHERWKVIDGFKDYMVSTKGRIMSLPRTIIKIDGRKRRHPGMIMKKLNYTNGYEFIAMRRDGESHQRSVHRLVAAAFIPNPNNKPQVNHINGVKDDNRIENLEWCTMGENNAHAYRTGLKKHHRCWKGKKGYAHNKSRELIVTANGKEKRYPNGS